MKLTCAIAACVLFAALSLTRPALPAEPQLQITSPRANSTVSGEVIELTGTGADPSGTLEAEVLTNQWWPQDGTGRIKPGRELDLLSRLPVRKRSVQQSRDSRYADQGPSQRKIHNGCRYRAEAIARIRSPTRPASPSDAAAKLQHV
jgi:hypothetical protein